MEARRHPEAYRSVLRRDRDLDDLVGRIILESVLLQKAIVVWVSDAGDVVPFIGPKVATGRRVDSFYCDVEGHGRLANHHVHLRGACRPSEYFRTPNLLMPWTIVVTEDSGLLTLVSHPLTTL